MLILLIGLVVGGFLIGGLARLAVPGPDPMPFWLTVAFGLGGGFLFGYAGAVLLVILYRRFVQKRGITGPEARAQPTRGWGLKRRS